MTTRTRPLMRYHGGKWKLARWIMAHFPTHRIYVEPFGGAASVLLQKKRAYAEVYNDLDGEIVNVFRVLRDPDQAAELTRLLTLTPFARDEFEMSYEPAEDPVEQARRTIFRSFAGFGSGAAGGHNTGFRSNSNRSGTTPAQDWRNYPDNLAFLVDRLRGVVIENKSAVEIIAQHDTSRTLVYADPPYPHSTRMTGAAGKSLYRHEMSDDEHRELAAALRAIEGYAIVSGYPCELYDDELFPDWHRVERDAHADCALDRIEVLWLSPRTWSAVQGGSGLPLFASGA